MALNVFTATFLAVILLLAAPLAASTIHQSFNYTSGSQDEALRAVGWCGGNAGDAFCDNPPGTIANQGGEGAVSVGNGADGAQGFAFWSQTDINADSFLYTDEIHFTTQSVGTRVEWFQSDSDPVGARIALLSDDTWYISDQVYSYVRSQPGDWGAMSAVIEDLTYFARSTGGDASVLPDGGVTVGGLVLASGTSVDAFGFWWDGPKQDTSRIDELSIASVPIPASIGLLFVALGGLVWIRGWRRRPA